MAYLKCLLWIDILAVLPLDRISFTLFVFKVGKLRQMARACSTIEHMVYKIVYNFPFGRDKDATNFTVGRSYGKFAYILIFGILGTFVLSMLIITFRFDFIFNEANRNESFFTIFTASMVYFVTTITTVGYGDITTSEPKSMIFSMFFQLLGIILYGYMLKQILRLINSSKSFL